MGCEYTIRDGGGNKAAPEEQGGYTGVGWMTLYISITPLQFDGLQ